MSKSKFKIVLLVWPIILLAGVFLYFSYERQQIDKKLVAADNLVWETNEKQFKTLIIQREDGELLHIQIKIIGPGSKEVYKTEEIINRDMFGGGFVRAAQVDSDPEKEIIIWHARAKYYLDFVQGSVKKVPFDQMDQQIKDLAKSWHRYNILAGLEMTSLIFFVFCYYGLYFLIKVVLKLFRRKSNGES